MVEALLLGLVAFIAQSEYALGTSLISRPIVTGLLTGLVLGDVQTGVIMGATLELAFIGSFSVGASIPPDVVTGGILGVAFAITSGAGTETALLPTRNETVTTAASISDRPNPAIKCIRSMPRRSARSAYPSAFWLSIGMNIPR